MPLTGLAAAAFDDQGSRPADSPALIYETHRASVNLKFNHALLWYRHVSHEQHPAAGGLFRSPPNRNLRENRQPSLRKSAHVL